jgi:hypothetical protein
MILIGPSCDVDMFRVAEVMGIELDQASLRAE